MRARPRLFAGWQVRDGVLRIFLILWPGYGTLIFVTNAPDGAQGLSWDRVPAPGTTHSNDVTTNVAPTRECEYLRGNF